MLVLFDAPINGRERKLVAQANRNGFYYVLDRATGEFLTAAPYAKQTWADGIDAKGRPIRKKGIAPSLEGTLVFPNIQGASNWFSPSYSPQTKLFYQAAREMGTIYYKGEAVYKPGTAFTGGGGRAVNGDDALRRDPRARRDDREAEVGVHAAVARLGEPAVHRRRPACSAAPRKATSSRSTPRRGKPLWDMQLGGAVRGDPDLVRGRRQAVRRDRRRLHAVRASPCRPRRTEASWTMIWRRCRASN